MKDKGEGARLCIHLNARKKMEPALNSLAAGFPWLIFFLLLATALYIIGMVVYVQLTPHKEITLIREGNVSAPASPVLSLCKTYLCGEPLAFFCNYFYSA